MERKYNVREITPKANMCIAAACPAIYEVDEITPKENMCIIGSCPAIYDIKNKTPTENACAVAACAAIYEDKSGKYLIVGKIEDAKNYSKLEGKVGEGEILISVPKEIIDNRRE